MLPTPTVNTRESISRRKGDPWPLSCWRKQHLTDFNPSHDTQSTNEEKQEPGTTTEATEADPTCSSDPHETEDVHCAAPHSDPALQALARATGKTQRHPSCKGRNKTTLSRLCMENTRESASLCAELQDTTLTPGVFPAPTTQRGHETIPATRASKRK